MHISQLNEYLIDRQYTYFSSDKVRKQHHGNTILLSFKRLISNLNLSGLMQNKMLDLLQKTKLQKS